MSDVSGATSYRMLARVAFYPTLLYNVVMEKVSSRQWYNRIDNTILLGALPFRSMTQQLKDVENLSGVVTLTEEFETRYFANSPQEWQAAGVEQITLATQDLGGAPTMSQLQSGVDFLLRHRDAGGSVYVHCKAGRTRSATLVACYLMKVREMNPEEAVNFIKAIRPHILLHSAQWSALYEFHTKILPMDTR